MIYDDLAEEYNIKTSIDKGLTKGDYESRETFSIIHDIYVDEGVTGLGELTLPEFREWVLSIEDYYHVVRWEDIIFNYINMWTYYCNFVSMIRRGHFRRELVLGAI